MKFRILFYSVLFLIIAYGFMIEPEWILIKKITLCENAKYRLVHISDIHYSGEQSYLNDIMNRINKISPDFVCFTGDLADEKHNLKQALNLLGKICCPIFGVPGNHEYWSGVSFEEIKTAFKNTRGLWLTNQQIRFGNLEITGMADEEYRHPAVSVSTVPDRELLLTHYPYVV